MPKNVPSEFTGRFSIKPKQSRSKLRAAPPALPAPSSLDEGAALSPLSDSLRDEPSPYHERKWTREGEEGSSPGDPGSVVSLSQNGDGELDAYSHQLEVNSPRYRQPSHQSDYSDHSGSQFGSSIQNVPLHGHRSPRPLAEPISDREKVMRILKSAWTKSNGSESDVSATAHRLAHFVSTTASPQDIKETPRLTVTAIIDFISEHPRALDFVFKAYDEAAKLLATKETNATNSLSRVCLFLVQDWLMKTATGFQGQPCPEGPGHLDIADRSNLHFRCPELSTNLDGVLARIHDFAKQRQAWIIGAAVYARCLSLDLMQTQDGTQALSLIQAGLDRRRHNWCKADMVGACILLRGCAKTLTGGLSVEDAHSAFNWWKSTLESHLLQGSETWDNDFVVKSHASVGTTSSTWLRASLTRSS